MTRQELQSDISRIINKLNSLDETCCEKQAAGKNFDTQYEAFTDYLAEYGELQETYFNKFGHYFDHTLTVAA